MISPIFLHSITGPFPPPYPLNFVPCTICCFLLAPSLLRPSPRLEVTILQLPFTHTSYGAHLPKHTPALVGYPFACPGSGGCWTCQLSARPTPSTLFRLAPRKILS